VRGGKKGTKPSSTTRVGFGLGSLSKEEMGSWKRGRLTGRKNSRRDHGGKRDGGKEGAPLALRNRE